MKEVICTWPDGSQKKVVLTKKQNGSCYILWNEHHSLIPGQGCVVGLDDIVPESWISEI